MAKLAVIGIGGNSIIRDKDHQRVSDQYEAIADTVAHIADVVELGYNVLLTHGNGPQVGFILRRSEIAYQYEGLHHVPLVSCVADTQGALGYQIQQTLGNEYRRRAIDREVVTIVTQVMINPEDPRLHNPNKPIGVFYPEEALEALKTDHPDWLFTEDAGRGFRRVVPSPKPLDIIEMSSIRNLVGSGATVIAAGGGGIPVIENNSGDFEGIDAVVDKDYTTALLASKLGAEFLIFITGVETLFLNFNTDKQQTIGKVSLEKLKSIHQQGHFRKGSMLPKVESVISYLEQGGKQAIITKKEYLTEALKGGAGTIVTK